jgi:hypothetical protein
MTFQVPNKLQYNVKLIDKLQLGETDLTYEYMTQVISRDIVMYLGELQLRPDIFQEQLLERYLEELTIETHPLLEHTL